jgi:hypothetical protein
MQTETHPHLPVNHVFVDLENVKTIDTTVLGGKNLTLHLFLGPQNKKLEVDVVEKLMEHSQVVQMIRSPKNGKNALDFVLAYHLGQAVLADPKGYFHIVSKDAGFDALVALLESRKVKVRRHEDWSALSLQSQTKPVVAVVSPTWVQKPAFSEAAQKLLENLRNNLKGRPKTEKKLITHAMNYTGKDKPDAEAKAVKVVGELQKTKLITVDDKGAVSYNVE